MAFKLRIKYEEDNIVKAKAEKLEDFEPIFSKLKKKFKDK